MTYNICLHDEEKKLFCWHIQYGWTKNGMFRIGCSTVSSVIWAG